MSTQCTPLTPWVPSGNTRSFFVGVAAHAHLRREGEALARKRAGDALYAQLVKPHAGGLALPLGELRQGEADEALFPEHEGRRSEDNDEADNYEHPGAAAARNVVADAQLVELVAHIADAHGVVAVHVAGGGVAADAVGVDADDRAALVDERAAGVAVVDLRVVLDEAGVAQAGALGEAGDDCRW